MDVESNSPIGVRVGATGMIYLSSQWQQRKNLLDQAEAFDFRVPDKVC